ncbi:MAG: peptidylprolyl isomerase [Polyangiaceae bacterium]
MSRLVPVVLAALAVSCSPAPAAAPPASAPIAVVDAASAGDSSSDDGSSDAPEQLDEGGPFVRLRLLPLFRRMVDCGHDGAVDELHCGYTAAGADRPAQPEQVLHLFLTEPPGLLLGAADWHPSEKLAGDQSLVADCELTRRGELEDVRLAATPGVPGWLYGGRVVVGNLSECSFEPGGELPEMMAAAHLLVMHDDSARRPPKVQRTREAALALAREAAQQLDGGMAFAEAVARVSDEPGAEQRAGDLGRFPPTAMVPEFTLPLLATPIGERSPVFETSFGFHIALRKTPRP